MVKNLFDAETTKDMIQYLGEGRPEKEWQASMLELHGQRTTEVNYSHGWQRV